MAQKIGALLLGVIVIGAIVFLYNYGVFGKGLQSLESLSPLNLSSSTHQFFPAYSSSGSLGGGGSQSASSSGSGQQSINPYDIPQGFTASELSPYFHQVRFSGVSPVDPSAVFYGSYGEISFSASYGWGSTSTIDVTGWQIKASHGGEFIPQAVQYYDPSGLNAPSDISLKSGDTLTLYSSSAPVNLRLNECMGYLPNKSQFKPQLPDSCPSIDRSAVQQFSGRCIDYVYSLGGCSTPDLSDPRIPTNDYACREYLADNFNYKSCYDENFTNSDFLSNQVWAWMGSSPVDTLHDRVELLDKNGLLVDYYSY